MTKKILIFFLITLAFGQDFKLNTNYRSKRASPEAKDILIDYEKFMNSVKNRSKIDKMNLVNSYLNSLNAVFDGNADDDYWSSRGEFLSQGGGDCEDYAIAKYYTLKDLGIKSKDMCLLVVKEAYSGFYHMVLGVWLNGSKVPKILDNLSFKILPLTKRIDLIPKYCINESSYYKIDKNGKKTEANIRFKAYEEMLKRQKKEYIWK